MAHTTCATNACGQVGGYCDYGDLVQPVCAQGYGVDSWITWHWQHEEVCGMGCAPCPDETDPEVWYLTHEPDGCADIDWACFDENLRGFDNECGCAPIPIP